MTLPAIVLPLLVTGCAAEPAVFDVVATVDPDIATVVHVTWTTAEPEADRVVFGSTDAYGLATPPESAETTRHEVTLLGLTADTDVRYSVVGATESSVDAVVHTDPLPSYLPEFEVISPMENAEMGPYLLTSTITLTADESTIQLLTLDGEPVWYWRPDVGVVSVRPLVDGTGVYFIAENPDDRSATTLTRVTWDGIATELVLPYAHHDAIENPDGGWVTLVTVFQDVDGERVAGDDIVEVSEDGSTRVVWDAFDSLTVEQNDGWDAGTLDGAADWTHANGITYDPSDDSYVVSLYFTESVVKVDRLTGGTVWQLGGSHSDFTFAEGDAFGPQHAPQVAGGGLWLFDNSSYSRGSRLVEYSLDAASWEASLTWAWLTPDMDWTPVLGDVQRFDDGAVLSSWGLAGQIRAVSPDGADAGELQLEDGQTVGQVSVVPGFYPGG